MSLWRVHLSFNSSALNDWISFSQQNVKPKVKLNKFWNQLNFYQYSFFFNKSRKASRVTLLKGFNWKTPWKLAKQRYALQKFRCHVKCYGGAMMQYKNRNWFRTWISFKRGIQERKWVKLRLECLWACVRERARKRI